MRRGGNFTGLVGDARRCAHVGWQPRGNTGSKFLLEENLEHVVGRLGQHAFPLVNHAKQADQPVCGDAVVEVRVERLVVFHAARQLDAADAMPRQHLLRLIDMNQIDQQIRRQVAARHDHVPRQLADAHRPADGGMHLFVGIAARGYFERRPVDEAEKAVPHVQARIEREAPRVDGAEQREQDGDFYGAG